MKPPVATYRLQFRNGMDFDRASGLVPYLKALGVSHLYASPIFTAVPRSTHGYDVTYHNEIDPTLGGRAGFERLSDALKGAGLGLILDIVPNHMAASGDNPWWRSVVEKGRASPFANHFDIDWSRRLTLPVLDGDFRQLAGRGEIGLDFDRASGRPAFTYRDQSYPLSDMTGLPDDPAALSADPDAMEALHTRQHFELIDWKQARRNLSYRRFFEVTGLVGVRVEEPAIFDEVHRLSLELVQNGKVDGLRIDHVDGLADPGSYLRQLRAAIGPDVYLIVEKILAADEHCPSAWPIDGTTGYEFIDALGDVFTDETAQPSHLLGGYERDLRRARQQALRINFEGELNRLADAFALEMPAGTDCPAIREALAALIVEFPVYRIYRDDEPARHEARERVRRAALAALSGENAPDRAAMDAVCRVLFADDGNEGAQKARTLFDQLTGPAMAKGVEDTLFYRKNAFLALNEVGCAPARPRHPDRFHARMTDRCRRDPSSLNATATHDTKRGEDARARLFAIFEDHGDWEARLSDWRGMLSLAPGLALDRDEIKRDGGGKPLPALDGETDALIFQSLAGAWPVQPVTPGREELDALLQRFLPFLEKALREAKQKTDWLDPDPVFEATARRRVEAILSPGNRPFHDSFNRFLSSIEPAARLNSLVQLVLKATAPGVPDIYQGTEAGDFSLVDPDNRRVPDFAALADRLQGPQGEDLATAKQRLTARLLRLRSRHAPLFARGDYVPLEATGARARHLLAFMRVHRDDAVLVVVPRLPRLFHASAAGSPDWGDTALAIPARFSGRTFSSLDGGELRLETSVAAARLVPGFAPGIWTGR